MIDWVIIIMILGLLTTIILGLKEHLDKKKEQENHKNEIKEINKKHNEEINTLRKRNKILNKKFTELNKTLSQTGIRGEVELKIEVRNEKRIVDKLRPLNSYLRKKYLDELVKYYQVKSPDKIPQMNTIIDGLTDMNLGGNSEILNRIIPEVKRLHGFCDGELDRLYKKYGGNIQYEDAEKITINRISRVIKIIQHEIEKIDLKRNLVNQRK